VQGVGGDFALGVDIHGLAALATKLYGYIPPSEEVVDAVEGAVKKLIGHAGWEGDDAKSFQDAWGADASDARKLTMFIDDAAKVIDNLASALAEIQRVANNRRVEVRGSGGYNPELAVLQDAQNKSNKLQREAARRLIALATEGGWSVLDSAKARSKDENLSNGLRSTLKGVEDDIDDARPDDAFPVKDFFEMVATGAGIGAAVGAPWGGVGALPGAAAGGLIGGTIGVVAGGGKWTIDQIDDWF
jgi:uncharacterized protein YukE